MEQPGFRPNCWSRTHIVAAVRKGGDAAGEDDTNGYALIRDPAARALQLKVRDYALAHEDELLRVLDSSADAQRRALAPMCRATAGSRRGGSRRWCGRPATPTAACATMPAPARAAHPEQGSQVAGLRASALDSLIEMARWRRSGHAFAARIPLGRIAGLPEPQVQDLAAGSSMQPVIDMLGRR